MVYGLKALIRFAAGFITYSGKLGDGRKNVLNSSFFKPKPYNPNPRPKPRTALKGLESRA